MNPGRPAGLFSDLSREDDEMTSTAEFSMLRDLVRTRPDAAWAGAPASASESGVYSSSPGQMRGVLEGSR